MWRKCPTCMVIRDISILLYFSFDWMSFPLGTRAPSHDVSPAGCFKITWTPQHAELTSISLPSFTCRIWNEMKWHDQWSQWTIHHCAAAEVLMTPPTGLGFAQKAAVEVCTSTDRWMDGQILKGLSVQLPLRGGVCTVFYTTDKHQRSGSVTQQSFFTLTQRINKSCCSSGCSGCYCGCVKVVV